MRYELVGVDLSITSYLQWMLKYFQTQVKNCRGAHLLPGHQSGTYKPPPPPTTFHFLSSRSSLLSHQHFALPDIMQHLHAFPLKLMMTTLPKVCSLHPRRRRPLLANSLRSWSPKVIVIFKLATFTTITSWQCQNILPSQLIMAKVTALFIQCMSASDRHSANSLLINT